MLSVAGPDASGGLTSSTVTPVSVEPPLILACVASRSRTLAARRTAGSFGLPLLRDDQEHLAQAGAQPGTGLGGVPHRLVAGDAACRKSPGSLAESPHPVAVESMLRVRLFTDDGALGALNRYSLREDAVAEMARIVALAAHAVASAAAQEIGQLRVAIEGRTLTGQAEGVLTERFGLSEAGVLNVVRVSWVTNRTLSVIVAVLVASRQLPAVPSDSSLYRVTPMTVGR